MLKTSVLIAFLLVLFSPLTGQINTELLVGEHNGTWYIYSERVEEEQTDGTTRIDELFSERQYSFGSVTFGADGAYNSLDFPSFMYKKEYDAEWKMLSDKEIELSVNYSGTLRSVVLEIEKLTEAEMVLKEPTITAENGLSYNKYYIFLSDRDKILSKEEADKKNKLLFPYAPLNEELQSLRKFNPSKMSEQIAQKSLLDKYLYNSQTHDYVFFNTDFTFDLYDLAPFDLTGIKSITIKCEKKKHELFFDKETKITKIIIEDDGKKTQSEFLYEHGIPKELKREGNSNIHYYTANNYFVEDLSHTNYVDSIAAHYWEYDNNGVLIKKRYVYEDFMSGHYFHSRRYNTRTNTWETHNYETMYGEPPTESLIQATNQKKIPFDVIEKDKKSDKKSFEQFSISQKGNVILVEGFEIDRGDIEPKTEFKIILNERNNIKLIEAYSKSEGSGNKYKTKLEVTIEFQYTYY